MTSVHSSRKALLSLGLGKHAKGFVPAGLVDVVRIVKEQWKEAHELGFDYGILDIDPDEETSTLEALEAELRKRDWDGVVIGGGLRSNLELSVIFEKIVNLCARELKSGAKLIFSSAPGKVVEALKRNFPGVGRWD